jgi:hypothetical protein
MNACLMEGVCVGLMAEDAIEIKTGRVDNDIEDTIWAEVWHGDELVHRSAHVRVKTMPKVFGQTGEIGG